MKAWLTVLALATITAGCTANAATPLPYYTSADFTPHWQATESRIANFSLTTQTGAQLSGHDLRGTIQVATFIFTRCSVICPVLVDRLQAVQAASRDWDDVRMVSFSVDPERDTPETLAAYAADHGIDARRWSVVTGDRYQITRLARDFYFADDNRLGGASDTLLHSEKVLLVDGDGRLRGIYNGTLKADITRLIDDIRTLRAAHAR
jgi:protein SCO1/2